MQAAEQIVFGPNTQAVILGRAKESRINFEAVNVEPIAVTTPKSTDQVVESLAAAGRKAEEKGRPEVANLLALVGERIASGASPDEVRGAIKDAREANADGKPVFEATLALARAGRTAHEQAGHMAGIIPESRSAGTALLGDEQAIARITELAAAKFGEPTKTASVYSTVPQHTPGADKSRDTQIS